MFKITVEQSIFKDSLSKLIPTLGKGSNGSFDNNLYMENYIDKATNKQMLRMMTTNQNEVGECSCELIKSECDNNNFICSLVNFNTFYNLICTIKSGTSIIIQNDSNGSDLLITYKGRNKPISLAGLNYNQFIYKPINDKYSLDITVSCADIKNCVDKASEIIVDNDYLVYSCIDFVLLKGQIIIKALDASSSKRMMIYSIHSNPSGKGNFLLRCESAKKIMAVLDENSNIRIAKNNNVVLIEQGNSKYYIRLVTGQFAKIESFMPNTYETEAIFDKEELLLALKRIKIVADGAKNILSCKFNIENAFSSIELNSTKGKILENVITVLSGNSKEMAFSISSMIKSINAIQENKIKFGFCKGKNNYVVVMPDTKKYIHRILIPAMNIKK